MNMFIKRVSQTGYSGHDVWKCLAIATLALGLVCSILPAGVQGNDSKADETLQVAGVFHTPIEEPWANRVHKALLNADKDLNVDYTWAEHISTADFGRVLRGFAEQGYDLIVGDAFGNEKVVRRIAARYPDTPFVFGSGGGAG